MPNIQGLPRKGENAVAVSKSQQKAVHKYVKANYDRMELTVPKGRKELIKARAEAQGQSVNAYINAAIDEKMSREAVGSSTRPAEAAAVSLPYEDQKRTPTVAQGRAEGVERYNAAAPTEGSAQDE